MNVVGKSILSVCLCLLCLSGTVSASEPLAQARLNVDEGRLEEAVALLSGFLEEHPSHPEALKLRALSRSGLGQFDAAVEDYERALERVPDDSEAHFDLGMILAFKKKDARHALVHLDRCLSLQPDDEMAVKVAEVMVSVDSGRTRIEEKAVEDLLEMARQFEASDRQDVAVRAYERVLEIHPTCATCHESLGRLLLRVRDRDKNKSGERHLAKAKLFRVNG